MDPAFHGTGIAGEEGARRRDYPDIYQGRIYFYTPGGSKEANLPPYKYGLRVAASALYDGDRDPLGLYAKASEQARGEYGPMDGKAKRTLYEKLIKESGYAGVFYQESKAGYMFVRTPTRGTLDWEGGKFVPRAEGEKPLGAATHFKGPKQVERLRGEEWVSPEEKEQIGRLAATQAGVFEKRWLEAGKQLMDQVDNAPEGVEPAREDRIAAGMIRPVMQLGEVSPTGEALDALRAQGKLDDLERAAWIVVQQDEMIKSRRVLVDQQLDKAAAELRQAGENVGMVDVANAESRVFFAQAEQLNQDYKRYMQNVRASDKPGPAAMAEMILQRAAAQPDGKFAAPGDVVDVLRQMVSRRGLAVDGKTNAEIAGQARGMGGWRARYGETLPYMFGSDDGQIPGALLRMKNLGGLIGTLRKLADKKEVSELERRAFEATFRNKPLAGKPGAEVTARQFARRYVDMLETARDLDTLARALDERYERARSRVVGLQRAATWLEGLTGTEQYRQGMKQALDVNDVLLRDVMQTDSTTGATVLKGPVSGREYRIVMAPTKEEAAGNTAQIKDLLKEIASLPEKADPLVRRTWNSLALRLEEGWMNATLAPEYNVFKLGLVGDKVKRGFKWFRNARTEVEFVGGLTALETGNRLMHLDDLSGKLEQLSEHKEYGDPARQVKTKQAMVSHGLDPKKQEDVDWYVNNVANPLLASQQELGQLHFGIGDSINGAKVTREDMELARVDWRHGQEVRRLSERDVAMYGLPTRIEEHLGGQPIQRRSVVGGPMTTARLVAEGMRDFMKAWDSRQPGDTTEKVAARQIRALSDPENFDRFVAGYVLETNPTFRRGSKYETGFRRIASLAKKGEVTLHDWGDVSEALRRVGTEVNEGQLQQDLHREISAWLMRFRDGILTQPLGKDFDWIPKGISESLHTAGTFLDARREMLGPSSWYNYSTVKTSEAARLRASAKNIARMRAIVGMNNMEKALTESQARLIEEAKAALSDQPQGQRELEKWSRAQQRAGRVRFTLGEINDVLGRLKEVRGWMEEAAKTRGVALDSGVNETIMGLNQTLIRSLLGSPRAIRNILVSSTGVSNAMMEAMIGTRARVLFAPLNSIRLTAGTILSRLPPGTLRNGVEALVGSMDDYREMRERLRRMGINIDYDWKGTREAWKTFPEGRVQGANEHVSWFAKMQRRVMSTWLMQQHERLFPRAVDQIGNVAEGMHWTQVLARLASYTGRITEVRGGADKLDATDPRQVIKPEELGINGLALTYLRRVFAPAGGLDAAIFDYAKRLAASPAGERENLPFMDEPKLEATLRNVLSMQNVVRESNAPPWIKARGVHGRLLGTFWSWTSNNLDQVVKLAGTRNVNGEKSGLPWLMWVGVATAVGAIANEVTEPLIELITGRKAGIPRLANVLAEPNPTDVGNYLLTAMSGMVPYVSVVSSKLMGGNGRPMFDLAGIVPLIGFVDETANTVNGVLHGGNASQAALNWVNRWAPLEASAANRLPFMRGAVEARDVSRVLRAAAPADMELRAAGGKGGAIRTSPMTGYLETAEAAAYSGDRAGVRSALDRAEAWKVKQGSTPEDAKRAVANAVRSRTPTMRVFGRSLTSDELARLNRRMTGGQRQSLEKGVAAMELLGQEAGARLDMGGAKPKAQAQGQAKAGGVAGQLAGRLSRRLTIKPVRSPGTVLNQRLNRMGAGRKMGAML